jgi:Icc-related predicted phosphoesterase
MRIQCAADFHGKKTRYTAFCHGIEEHSPDLVILAGDLNSSPYFLEFLRDITVPVFTTSGNMDGSEAQKLLGAHSILLDGKHIIHGGVSFVGVGGSKPYIDTLRSYSGTTPLSLEDTPVDVLISHVPPKGMMDKMTLTFHIGSVWVRDVVEKKRPRLVVCGHVHENPGYARYGDTLVVNCSVGRKGAYTLIELGSKITVRMEGY